MTVALKLNGHWCSIFWPWDCDCPASGKTVALYVGHDDCLFCQALIWPQSAASAAAVVSHECGPLNVLLATSWPEALTDWPPTLLNRQSNGRVSRMYWIILNVQDLHLRLKWYKWLGQFYSWKVHDFIVIVFIVSYITIIIASIYTRQGSFTVRSTWHSTWPLWIQKPKDSDVMISLPMWLCARVLGCVSKPLCCEVPVFRMPDMVALMLLCVSTSLCLNNPHVGDHSEMEGCCV